MNYTNGLNEEYSSPLTSIETLINFIDETVSVVKQEKKEPATYKSKNIPRNISLFNKKQARTQRSNITSKKKKVKNSFYNNNYSFKNNVLEPCNENSKFNNKLNPGGINNDIFSYKFMNSNEKGELFCVNCGNIGHDRMHCNEPHISLGVVAIRYNTNIEDYEFLCVMRRNSHGYCDLIRGKYKLDDIQHIKNLLEETTLYERDMLLNKDFYTNWIFLWGENNPVLKKLTNVSKLREKFNNLKFNNSYHFKELINDIKSKWVEPEWGFPKGQRSGNEKNIDTAFREFSEETGYSTNDTICISNLIPLEEIFTGSNNEKYKQIYYICFMDFDKTHGKIDYQQDEIGNAMWLTYNNVYEKFRCYNKEKLTIVDNLYKMVQECDFVFI